MTRALVTQLVEALDAMYSEGLRLGWHAHPHWSTGMANTNAAITAAREYLATEPKQREKFMEEQPDGTIVEVYPPDGRAALIEKLRWAGAVGGNETCSRAADMLEADAQPKQVTCQIYGHVVGACVECNTHIEAQQATPDIKALQSNGKGPAPCARFCEANAFEIEIRRLKAEINAQQAKRVPMTGVEIRSAWDACIKNTNRVFEIRIEFARAIEAHHGIGGEA